MRFFFAALAGWLFLGPAAGCSTVPKGDDAWAAYERTQQDVQNGRMEPSEARPPSEERLVDLSPSNIGNSLQRLSGTAPNRGQARQSFEEARQLYQSSAAAPQDQRAATFSKAGDKFAAAAGKWPGSSLEHDALYWAGQAYFFADRYPAANHQFELLLKKFPNSKYIDQVEARRFAIAMYWLELSDKAPQAFYSVNFTNRTRPWRDTYGHALRILDRIRIDDPNGRLADDATLAAGNAYFQAGRYLKADEYYTDLIRTFPSSEHQFTAHYLGVQSKLQAYQGPDYSGQALTDAEKLVRQMRKQFPREAQQQRDFLNRTFARIQHLKAEREWARAQYHARRGEHRAARMFYARLLENFPSTQFAAEAQSQMAATANLPAKPPQRLSWLVDAFPTEDDTDTIAVKPTLRR